MRRLIGVELHQLVRSRRTWVTILLIDLLPTIVAVLLKLTDVGPRPGTGPAFLSAVLTDGTLFPLAAMAIVLPLFLPIAVCIQAGDAIAGEAQQGTLRYLLVRPVGRTRLLVAKLVSVMAFVLLTLAVVAATAYVVGVLLLGTQRVAGATTTVSGTPLTQQELVIRTFLALAYALLCMLGVAAIALFLSTVVDTPLAAALGTMAVLVASTLLLTLDAADSIGSYLPTRYWLSFVDLFRDPILWRDVVRGTLLQGAYVLVFLGAGVGQLRHQGRQGLSPVDRGAERPVRAAVPAAVRAPGSRDEDSLATGHPRPAAGQQISGPGTAGRSTPSSRMTAAMTTGERGRSRWETVAAGQTDWTVKSRAPSRSADEGGTTVWSSVVQIETQTGPAGVSSPAFSARSRSLSGWSCWQATGQVSGARSPARPARSVPWCGDPMRDDPAREAAAAVVADPEAGDHAAGGVPDHVHRAGAGALLEEDRGLLQHLRLLVEVAEPVAGELHDHGLPALRAERVGHHLEAVRAAAVPRHEQHRAGGRLRDRAHRVLARHPPGHPADDRGDHDEQRRRPARTADAREPGRRAPCDPDSRA